MFQLMILASLIDVCNAGGWHMKHSFMLETVA